MNDFQIINGDCQELSRQYIPDRSVDLIFTDPPYPKQYLYLYKWLAEEATRVLKPAGFLIAYTGPYWKAEVMKYMNKKLVYFYDFVLAHKGNTSILWPRRVISGYKSLLCYHLKDVKQPLPVTNVLGRYDGTGGDKRFHHWGQDANTARYYIDVFSREGDLVVDYFLGGGTFAEVSKRLGRRFIGFEKDEASFTMAKDRIEGALGPAEKGRQELMI